MAKVQASPVTLPLYMGFHRSLAISSISTGSVVMDPAGWPSFPSLLRARKRRGGQLLPRMRFQALRKKLSFLKSFFLASACSSLRRPEETLKASKYFFWKVRKEMALVCHGILSARFHESRREIKSISKESEPASSRMASISGRSCLDRLILSVVDILGYLEIRLARDINLLLCARCRREEMCRLVKTWSGNSLTTMLGGLASLHDRNRGLPLP